MKQKQVKPSPKILKKVKALKRPTPIVKIQKKVQESDEDEVIEEKVKPRKPAIKKTSKVPKFVVEEPSDDGEEEEEVDDIDEDAEEQEMDDIEEDAEEQEEDEGVSDADGTEEDKENENGEEEEAENGDGAEESEEDDGDDDDDDEAPKEEATEREEPTLPSKVKSGSIPMTVPSAKVIFIKNLPKNCKQVDIVEVFAKYGAIDQIHINPNPNSTVAHVAYKTEKAANAALAANEKAKIKDSVLSVRLRRENNNTLGHRTIYVKFIKKGTSEEEIREHFKSCGEIENINLIEKFNQTFAYIKFKEQSSIPAALKLNNTLLNGFNIRVKENDKKNDHPLDERFTIILRNKQNLENLDATKLEAIFSKCGEISNLNLICSKNVLAFINFKTEEAAQKALELNGKILQGIDLEIEAYSRTKKWTAIHVSNLPKDCTHEDLKNCFSKAGKIDDIKLKEGGNFAIIRFSNSDGYCKSFLYNETAIKGKKIFVMPYSHLKITMINSNKFKNTGFKRHAQNGHSAFKPKRGKFY